MLALIDINLLPGGKRGAGRPKAGRKLSMPSFEGFGENLKGDPLILGLIVLAVLVVGHFGFLFVTQAQRLGSVEADLEAQRQDSVRFAENIAAADSLRARQDTLLAKANVIRAIDGDRYVWAHILNEVSVALPEFTWLTALQQSAGSGDDVEFRIEGQTGATAALTRFMRGLAESPFLRDVRLVSQEQVQQGQKLVHGFVLLARYEIPDSSVVTTEPIILAGE